MLTEGIASIIYLSRHLKAVTPYLSLVDANIYKVIAPIIIHFHTFSSCHQHINLQMLTLIQLSALSLIILSVHCKVITPDLPLGDALTYPVHYSL